MDHISSRKRRFPFHVFKSVQSQVNVPNSLRSLSKLATEWKFNNQRAPVRECELAGSLCFTGWKFIKILDDDVSKLYGLVTTLLLQQRP